MDEDAFNDVNHPRVYENVQEPSPEDAKGNVSSEVQSVWCTSSNERTYYSQMNNIKLCIFDVDGVVVNSRALHYPATRDVLAEYGFIYGREDDDNFGTIPTRHKLHLLAEYGNISTDDIDDIWELKDTFACEYFDDSILLNDDIKPLFEELKNRRMRIVGSNARYTFLEKVINSLGVRDLVDFVTGGQDGKDKPDPYMYTNGMDKFLFHLTKLSL